ncbi:MAG: hypothetical protein BGO67_03160 [Alphaproteobacteria bacterium 41-28]|mgnify:CR=1 FL=1|nr:MAG: hypothetical protein BGO67_03160 [Alphaproteobacteria bacterium 41-28]
MQETQTLFPQDLHAKHLSTINNIHFTIREIDVIACLLSARGTSKTAFFLSIDPRTVETHIRNIMSKLKCNTREGIIDFIEASDKLPILRKYYSLLRMNMLFEKSLKDISKLNREEDFRCYFIVGKDKIPLITHLKSHLNLTGIVVLSAARKKEGDHGIFILPNTLKDQEIFLLQKAVQSSNKILFLLQERRNYKDTPNEIMNFDVVDFAKHENYYFTFFTILKKILPHHNIDTVIGEFKDKCKKIHVEPTWRKMSSHQEKSKPYFVNRIKGNPLLVISFIVVFFFTGFAAFYWTQKNESFSFRSDLVIPTESVLLNRSELIAQIDDKLKRGDGIQTIALVGPGGAGKTTLARQYAHMQKASSIWEINAETHESLNTSFEKLAHALSKREVDQKVLRSIQAIKDTLEKEDKIIQFVNEHLKSTRNWILIYDNVETFTDIQKYFPQDSNIWRQGKIILTTRNSNVGSNNHVNHVIFLGELTPLQKLYLFKKIIVKENSPAFTETQTEEAKYFLEKIPPFPLDVSIAAYYIKTTNISYRKYLENLFNFNNDFASAQENLLKEIGNYTNTRYRIIILSLQNIINAHKDFCDLLLMVSLIDSQNIPRDLLNKFKNQIVVDNFIFNLKKYSLITNDSSTATVEPTFSIHRSTQEISLTYLIKLLALEKNKDFLQNISSVLEKYMAKAIDEDNILMINLLAGHSEKFLTHINLLNNIIKGLIGGQLGFIYFYLGYDIKAKETLEKSLSYLNKNYIEKNSKVARILLNLGSVYRYLGHHEKAKKLIEKSLIIYKKSFSENHIEIAWSIVALGIVNRELGNYEKSKKLLEQSLLIYEKYFTENTLDIAWSLTQLGHTYKYLGNYQKSKNLLERAFKIYQKSFGDSHPKTALVFGYLGNVYMELGHYERAKKLIETGYIINKDHYPENCLQQGWSLLNLGVIYQKLNNFEKAQSLIEQSVVTLENLLESENIKLLDALVYLGEIYKERGYYEKAKSLFKKCLLMCEKRYGKQHLEIGRLLRSIGQTYLKEGRLETAENLLKESLRILQQNEHPDSYTCSESLAEVYLKKSIYTRERGDTKVAQNFKIQAIDCLKQALEIVKANFTEDSPHVRRIQFNLKILEQ